MSLQHIVAPFVLVAVATATAAPAQDAAPHSEPTDVVRLTVTTAAPVDAAERLYFASETNGWNPADAECILDRLDEHTWRIDITVVESIEYKITRGSWDTVEVAANGRDVPNHVLTPGEEAVSLTIELWADQRTSIPPRPSTVVGDLRTHRAVHSPQLDNKRDIFVFLPPGYDDAERAKQRYPVLYMHDGQNLFDNAVSFAGEWEVDETVTRLVQAGHIDPIIVVGIANHGADRVLEYSPYAIPASWRTTGTPRGDAYLAFLIDTVKPMIDETYRTLPGRAHTAIAGSSMGGLISLHAGITRPDVFSRVGVMSPALFPFEDDDFAPIRNAETISPVVWLDCGTAEGSVFPEDYVRQVKEAARLLKPKAKRFMLVIDKDAMHNEAAWRRRLPMMLRFFYERPK
ncbi:MAG: alpha/beta hydrolase [Phycisphaerales bacterium]|nr:alpha/beta hydrolase [Phycisphaerales bacterium]